MTHLMARHFFPVTTGLGRDYAPRIYEFLFPGWAAEKCPMPYANLQTPRGDAVTVFWPLTAVVIFAGLVTCWLLGMQLLVRALRQGAQARRGLFIWSSALLSYGFMCLGGFFFHCFHIRPIFHMMDVASTGLASLSIIAGFAAFVGLVDDRTTTQRLAWVASAVGFVVVDLYSPSFVQEQLYALPAFGAAGAGAAFLLRSLGAVQKSAEQAAGLREAQLWLLLAGFGVVVGAAALPLDKYLCLYLGAEFSFLFWFFLGCNSAMFAVHRFALVVADKNLQFTDVKRQ
ncbi:hypothetical protein KC19_10G061800 [Ceratodon purpureus]|uniref:Uncharacterized protein n=1 Tax=Ceratodon purpureus TaxID=3225 RepID=A0A8T0GIP2_CERPU|nr:hypothetical protein KC19_10G061800 [Ceratodon purpureus]